MKISIACDHGALALKNLVAEHLKKKGHEVLDFGTYTTDSCDYPDFAAPAARAVASGECERERQNRDSRSCRWCRCQSPGPHGPSF